MSARVVGWTVGPRDDSPVYVSAATNLRVKFDAAYDVARPRKGYYVGTCHFSRRFICLWPTRAAALAAGRAFGWKEPVARRVVRR